MCISGQPPSTTISPKDSASAGQSTEIGTSENVVETSKNLTLTPESTNMEIKQQVVVRLDRISEENQALMQKSLSEFVQTKPELAKELGIELNKRNAKNYKEESDVEGEGGRSSRRKNKRKYKESDDEFEPDEDNDPTDTFSALVGKRRKVGKAKEEPEPESFVLSKPKLRRVEKKFVPVLQKLSTEELMESNTYVRFNKSVEHVLRSGEDIDFAEIGMCFVFSFLFWFLKMFYFSP